MTTPSILSTLQQRLSPLSDPWQGGLLLISLLLALPVVVIYASLTDIQWELWQHLADTVLSDYVTNSLLLALGVGLGTLLIGTGMAWTVVHFDFVGRKHLQWIALLPLAMPAYIIAYTYTGILDVAGPVQSGLREQFNWRFGDYWFPEVRSLPGAICMMLLVLYPYVFMLARTAFKEQSASLWEAASSAGYSRWGYFYKVSLPLARPAILTGMALAMMEAFADYGTVQYFGVNTFTTGIFRTWFGLGNGLAAAQLSSLLCTFVLVLLVLEKYSRRRLKYYYSGQSSQPLAPRKVTGFKSVLLLMLCLLPPLLGFFVPLMQLLSWSLQTYGQHLDGDFMDLVWNSFKLAAMAAVLVLTLALLLAYGKRLKANRLMNVQIQTASLGYAIPGTVIAVGVMLPLSWFDRWVNMVSESLFDVSVGLVFSGTVFALLLAYSVRFLSVALHNVEAGIQRITPNMDEAARSLGRRPINVLAEVHLPMLKGSALSAMLLVFVDVLKELPATLILRPFNFNTLAVRAYELASDERLVDAALPAVSIVLVGIVPVILLTRALNSEQQENNVSA